MGFMWEGSTGARAVKLLREQPQGTVILTPKFAEMLGVKAIALHQLLANAVDLRMIKKGPARRGVPASAGRSGSGNISVTIESAASRSSRRPASRISRAAAPRPSERRNRPAPPPPPSFRVDWPPGFVSQLGAPARTFDDELELAIGEPVQLALFEFDDLFLAWRRSARRRRARPTALDRVILQTWWQLAIFEA